MMPKNNKTKNLCCGYAFDSENLRRLADQLPCFICIFDRNGTLRYMNPAMLRWIGMPEASSIVGQLNLHALHPPDFEAFRLSRRMEKVLHGEVDFAASVLIPVYQEDGEKAGLEDFRYASVCAFPIGRADGNVQEIGFLFFPHTREQMDVNVMRCRLDIERNWRKPFDMDRLAEDCSMSRNHLSKMFKQTFGMTPFQYYRWVKLENVRVGLGETCQSVAQVFEACGMQYSGFMAREFKKFFGLSPREYRKTL